MAFNIIVQFIQKMRLIWSAISWVFSVRSEIEGIQHELATMNAFLEEAENVPERAKIKGQWIRRVRGLAYDVEDCLDEFKRRLLHPTDEEIICCFLQIGSLLRTWADACFLKLKTTTWFPRISTGTRFRRVRTSFHSTVVSTIFHRTAGTRFCGVGTCIRRVGTSFYSTGARFLTAGVELGAPLLRTGVERGIPLLKPGSRLLRMGHAYFWLLMDVARMKASVKEASNTAQRFGFISMPSNAIPAAAAGSLTQRLNARFIQDDALVGIEKPRDELLNLLLDEHKAETCVISVVGCGGLGKTTLVRRVFESQMLNDGGRFGDFSCRAWVTVSTSFELKSFLKKVFHQLSLDGFNHELDPEELISMIRSHLDDKRYVIVFDDVWTLDSWEDIKHVFPGNMKGSRVIVTTRDENVARTCCIRNHKHVLKLPTLSTKQSMTLFSKLVFDGHSCPNYLKVPSKKIIKKCGGVPLVIETIGGVLASKPARDVNDWNGIVHHLGSRLRNNPNLNKMMQIMSLSYNALPNHHLKHCFLYLSVFPQDYEIDCKQLQALWIAEGLVGHHDGMTQEEAAESYLNEFLCRNMIQASEISDRGRVTRCWVHDVMLEFIISKSTEQNLVTLSRKHGAESSQAEVRRLSLHPFDSPDLPFENTRSDHLRSFFLFGAKSHYLPQQDSHKVFIERIGQRGQPEDSHKSFLSTQDSHKLLSFICRSSRFIRVLELNDLGRLTNSHIHEIGKLYHLKHLNLRGSNIDCVPESFGGLENLETLDVGRGCTIPAAVFRLTKLRHLRGKSLRASQGLGSSKTLQTLYRLYIEGGEVQELRSLTQLIKLGVMGLRPGQENDFCASISEMSSCLRSLKVDFNAENTAGYLDSLASPPVFLQSLRLEGYLGKLPTWINSLNNVSKIVLIRSELQFDGIRALQKLPNLIKLALQDKSYIGNKLHFDGEGFDRLKILYLAEIPSLESLAFGAGCMPTLQGLDIRRCDLLSKFGKFDRENLPCLNKVVFRSRRPYQLQRLRRITEAHPNNPIFVDYSSRFGPPPPRRGAVKATLLRIVMGWGRPEGPLTRP